MPNLTLTAERALTIPRPGWPNRLRALVGRPVHTFTPNIYAEALVHTVPGRAGSPTLHIDGADHRGRVKVRLASPDGGTVLVQRVTVRERGAAFVSYPHTFRIQEAPAAVTPSASVSIEAMGDLLRGAEAKAIQTLKEGMEDRRVVSAFSTAQSMEAAIPEVAGQLRDRIVEVTATPAGAVEQDAAPPPSKVVSRLTVKIDGADMKRAAEEVAAEIRAGVERALPSHWVQRRKLWDTVSSPITEDLLWASDALQFGDLETVAEALDVIRSKVELVAEAAQDAAMAVDGVADGLVWAHDGKGGLTVIVRNTYRLKRNLNQMAGMVRAIADRAPARPRVVRTKGV